MAKATAAAEAAEATEAEIFPPLPRKPIENARLKSATTVRTQWRLTVKDRNTYSWLLENPTEAAAQWGDRVVDGDWIEVWDDAGSFFAILLVALCIPRGAGGVEHLQLVELLLKDLGPGTDKTPQATGEHYVMWGGGHRKWMLVGPGGNVLRDGMHSKFDANNAMAGLGKRPLHQREFHQ
jgi:hypothetical protein